MKSKEYFVMCAGEKIRRGVFVSVTDVVRIEKKIIFFG